METLEIKTYCYICGYEQNELGQCTRPHIDGEADCPRSIYKVD